MEIRKATITRKTNETDITITLNIDGEGNSKVDTGIGILNHMLELFAFWGHFDLDITAKGDIEKVDTHHTNEDVGIVLGQAFKKALGDKKGIKRFGDASVPMENAVATVAADISGRGFFEEINGEFVRDSGNMEEKMKKYSLTQANHFFEALAKNMGVNLNIELSSKSIVVHTNLEPIFKALGKALDEATQIDPRRKGIPSTKGIID